MRNPSVWILDGFGTGLETRDRLNLWRTLGKIDKNKTTVLFNVPVDQAGDVDKIIFLKRNKVEDVAPTVQELFQARYGPGVVVIPHIPTNKLLIYLPPPRERERAGATGVRSGRTSSASRGTTRGSTTRTR